VSNWKGGGQTDTVQGPPEVMVNIKKPGFLDLLSEEGNLDNQL